MYVNDIDVYIYEIKRKIVHENFKSIRNKFKKEKNKRS